ncbi:MAG: glucose-6-phosphate isomerase [Vicinamibacterales bacterium]
MPTANDLITRWPDLAIGERRDRLQQGFRASPGRLGPALAPFELTALRAVTGLWNRDPALWSADPEVQARIAQRLGWLTSPALMADAIDRLKTFAAGVRQDGFTDVVLLGMGGSSLAPEVLRSVVGPAPGWLRLHMIDSTDPAAVLAIETDVQRTLYIFASKSGTTIEPNSLAAFFRQGLEHGGVKAWAKQFVAITDEGTELAAMAQRRQFREVFINPSDIGGRYSAVSYFGLVPAALMGQDLEALVGYALGMLSSTEPGEVRVDRHGAFALGVAMAAGARHQRDKLTLLVPAELEAFGLWVEQLVAESTGKQGVGVVPITGEALGAAEDYGDDRLFVRMRIAGSADASLDAVASALEGRGAPIYEITMPDATALGAEFVRWEVATAVAGALLAINPFDEPNVAQAKEATKRILNAFKQEGQLVLPTADRTADEGVTFTLTRAAREALGTGDPQAILSLLRPGDYVALLAYLGPSPALAATLQAFRMGIRDRTRIATMFGYGPRYLHSTGQLHKGGPNNGLFVLVTSHPRVDFPIPGEAFSFGTLELAQALGDFQSLDGTGRRALHIHLPEPVPELLQSSLTPLLTRLAAVGG